MKINRLRLLLLCITILVIAGLIASRHHSPRVTALSLPSAVLVATLECMQLLYGVGRNLSFRRRELRRKVSPAYDLQIPSGTKTREQYCGAEAVHKAQTRFISEAVDAQGAYFRTGILAAILPPLALLMLSAQLLIVANGGDWAKGLVTGELICLGRLAFIALTQQRPTATWIEARIRAELFRREEYLLIAQIGPYLGLQEQEIQGQVDRRVGLLLGAEESELRSMISSHNFLNGALVDYQPSGTNTQDLLDRMNSYLYLRIGKQLLWFSNEIRDCRENESLWSKVLVASLLSALVVAFAHLFHLAQEAAAPGDKQVLELPGTIIGILAVLLPPAATAIISIKNMYAFNGKTRVYEHQRANLTRYDGEMRGAVRQAQRLLDHTDTSNIEPTRVVIDKHFRFLALLTEASLSNEMEKWSLLMERESVEVNA